MVFTFLLNEVNLRGHQSNLKPTATYQRSKMNTKYRMKIKRFNHLYSEPHIALIKFSKILCKYDNCRICNKDK